MKTLLFLTVIAMGTAWKAPKTPVTPQLTDREKVMKVALDEVGIREKTGKNDGDVEKYITSVGLNGKAGYPYCVAYIYWVGKKALGSNNPYPKSAWSPDFVRGGSKITSKTVIQPADVFGLYDYKRKRVSHGGFCQSRSGNYLITVEANTTNTAAIGSEEDREAGVGGGVYRKRRYINSKFRHKNWIRIDSK